VSITASSPNAVDKTAPSQVDWATLPLPDAWPDPPRWRDLRKIWHLALRLISRRPRPVQLPGGMPGLERLPSYLFQEFHLLPNGNFSKTITESYAIAFDGVMLRTLVKAREIMAEKLAGAKRVVDVGSGAGNVAAALLNAGIPEVYAVEPSPYLLQTAARKNPGLKCVQAVIEDSGLPDHYFDGAAACFVFHEIPASEGDRALRELHRILRPGARLVIVEPSEQQINLSFWAAWRRYGWRGVYFKGLASGVFEPFLDGWHGRDHGAWFAENGFRLEEDRDGLPWRMLVAVNT
jgi:ubiquinone/menaquinone biosynthesis C-methylase UbiE